MTSSSHFLSVRHLQFEVNLQVSSYACANRIGIDSYVNRHSRRSRHLLDSECSLSNKLSSEPHSAISCKGKHRLARHIHRSTHIGGSQNFELFDQIKHFQHSSSASSSSKFQVVVCFSRPSLPPGVFTSNWQWGGRHPFHVAHLY